VKKFLLLIFLITCYESFLGQTKKLDSLNKVYHNKNEADTNRLKALYTIAWSYTGDDPDTAIVLAEEELKLINSIPQEKRKRWIAKAYSTIGNALINKGDYANALTYFFTMVKLYEELKSIKSLATCYGYIGTVYFNQSNYPKALNYYLKNLKIAEEVGDKKGIENCYNNLGNVYLNLANYPKALSYHFKALQAYTASGNQQGIAACYINIGIVYEKQVKNTQAIEYYLKGLEIMTALGDKQGIVSCHINMSNVYADQLNYTTALNYLIKALAIKKEIEDEQGVGLCYGNMGSVYAKLGNYKLAIRYSDSCLKISKKIGDINEELEAHENLSEVYATIGKYKKAYEHHVKFKQLTDSIFNEDNSKQLGDLKTQFEVEKKEAELKIKSDAEQEKLKAIAAEETKRQQVIIASVAGVLLVVLVFSLFLYKRFKIAQKQKAVIEEQKVLVDKAYNELHEKNKEVMDSIRYAKRIQTALITSEKYIESSLNKLMKK